MISTSMVISMMSMMMRERVEKKRKNLDVIPLARAQISRSIGSADHAEA